MLVPFMFGPTPLRDIFLVAGFELRELARSKRALMFAALYMLVAAVGSYGFVELISRVPLPPSPNQIRRDRGGPFSNFNQPTPSRPDPAATGTAGAAAKPQQARLFQRDSPFRGILSGSVDEQDAVDFLAAMPAITLLHMLISILIRPLVIMITSSESISQEHQSRGVRYVALRTGRAEFVLGKILGQGVTMALTTLLAGAVCMAIAAWRLQDFEFFPTLSALFLFWPRLLAYCFAFLGLAGLCSMNTNSTVGSRTFSLIGLVSLWFISHLVNVYIDYLDVTGGWARLLRAIDFFSPFSHQNDLWYPEVARYGGAMASLIFLGAFYLAIGLINYRERDL